MADNDNKPQSQKVREAAIKLKFRHTDEFLSTEDNEPDSNAVEAVGKTIELYKQAGVVAVYFDELNPEQAELVLIGMIMASDCYLQGPLNASKRYLRDDQHHALIGHVAVNVAALIQIMREYVPHLDSAKEG